MLISPPHLTYGTAKSYVQSAFVLMNSPDRFQVSDDTTFFHPFHMLVGFAVELYLKAFLLHVGLSAEELARRPYGHDLEALQREAVARGLNVEGLAEVVDFIGGNHRDYTFRYPRGEGNYPVPALNVLFRHLSMLNFAVDVAIGARAALGLASGGAWVLPEDRAVFRVPV